jgi:prophage regulatory protein
MSEHELASIAEIAALLGVPKRTAARYSERDDFPAPVDVLSVGRIWRRSDVEQWAKTHLPLRAGRPATQSPE